MTETQARVKVAELNAHNDGYTYWVMRLKTGEWKIGRYDEHDTFCGYLIVEP